MEPCLRLERVPPQVGLESETASSVGQLWVQQQNSLSLFQGHTILRPFQQYFSHIITMGG